MTSSVLFRYLDPDLLNRLASCSIDPLGLVGGNLTGAHKSPQHGFAVEFSGHRDYVVGDDLRHMDWRHFYKRDRLVVKQYEVETNFVCHLLLDISASMRYGEGLQQKLMFAARALTTMGYLIVNQNDKVSLATFDNRVRGYVPPGNSLAQVERMTQQLHDVLPNEKTNMAESLKELTGRMGQREIVMIFSDFFTDLESLETVIKQMKYQRHEVLLFHVLHHQERSFELQGLTKFIGLEDENESVTESEDIRAGYLDAFFRYEQHLVDICRTNATERVVLDTSRGFGDDLIEYLNQRNRVRVRK